MAAAAGAGMAAAGAGGGMAAAALNPATLATFAASAVASVGFMYTCVHTFDAYDRCLEKRSWYHPMCAMLFSTAMTCCASGIATGVLSAGIASNVVDQKTLEKFSEITKKRFSA